MTFYEYSMCTEKITYIFHASNYNWKTSPNIFSMPMPTSGLFAALSPCLKILEKDKKVNLLLVW